MKRRDLLHATHIDEFKKFLIDSGWGVRATKGDYEVLRAQSLKTDKLLMVYDGNDRKEHLTTFGMSTKMAIKFYQRRKQIGDEVRKPIEG